MLRPVVVDDGDGHQPGLRVAQHLAHHQMAALSRADDHDASRAIKRRAVAVASAARVQHTPQGANAEQQERAEHDRQRQHGARQGQDGVDRQADGHLGDAYGDDGAADHDRVAERGMLPRLDVQAERDHRDALQDQTDPRVPGEARQRLGRDEAVEAEQVRDDGRKAPYHDICNDLVGEQGDARHRHSMQRLLASIRQ